MDERRAVSRGPLPLSPKATLKWLALAGDTLTPVTMDSSSVVRAWSPAFGGAWSRSALVAEGDAASGVWPTGVSGGELHYVQCDAGEWPQVCPLAPLAPSRSHAATAAQSFRRGSCRRPCHSQKRPGNGTAERECCAPVRRVPPRSSRPCRTSVVVASARLLHCTAVYCVTKECTKRAATMRRQTLIRSNVGAPGGTIVCGTVRCGTIILQQLRGK